MPVKSVSSLLNVDTTGHSREALDQADRAHGVPLMLCVRCQGRNPRFSNPQSLATWENENKIHCTQTLLEGDGPKTYWTRELANDELILVRALDPVP